MRRSVKSKSGGFLAIRRVVLGSCILAWGGATLFSVARFSTAEEPSPKAKPVPPADQVATKIEGQKNKAAARDIETLLEKLAEHHEPRYPDTKIENPLTDEEVDRLVRHFRGKYPLESLRERLAYEKKHRKEKSEQRQAVAVFGELSQEEELELHAILIAMSPTFDGDMRSHSLKRLHSKNVKEFITREGFGVGRMVAPTPAYLELEEPIPAPVAFDPSPVVSAGQLEEYEVPLLAKEPDHRKLLGEANEDLPVETQAILLSARYSTWADLNNPLRLPTMPRLRMMHIESQLLFTAVRRNGFVRDIDHVAGFNAHVVTEMPRLEMGQARIGKWSEMRYHLEKEEAKAKAKAKQPVDRRLWLVTRMELVSLLKHDKPGVYVSDTLPDMKKLGEVKTRALDAFEDSALKRLEEGEKHVVHSQTNQIRMLGSLRASERCMECHDVDEGTLLGAFSYELTRKKPITIKVKEEDLPQAF